jgi:hypothetical protein
MLFSANTRNPLTRFLKTDRVAFIRANEIAAASNITSSFAVDPSGRRAFSASIIN